MKRDNFHEPVLYQEVLDSLNVKPGEIYIDATIGGGGHTKGILELGGKVIGIDIDPEALRFVRQKLTSQNLILEQGNFVNVDKILAKHGVFQVSGVVFDLGPSSYQLDSASRGFGFKHKAPLDMRMSPELAVTAKDLVNGLAERELYELFSKLGEERHARRIARAIVASRLKEKIERTDQLASIVGSSIGHGSFRIHPATRVFLALRIAVNDELNNLKKALPKTTKLLRERGRLAVISFHSLEDRIVKNFIKESRQLVGVNKKPIVPTKKEIERNPRARSAKLRIAEKINLEFKT